MKKAVTPKKLVQYAIFISVAWISYRLYASLQSGEGEEEGQRRAYGPRDIGRGRQGLGGRDDEDLAAGPEDLDDRLRKFGSDPDRDTKRRNAPRVQKDSENEFRLRDDRYSDDIIGKKSRSDHAEDRYRRQRGVGYSREEEEEGEGRHGVRNQFDHRREGGRHDRDEERDKNDGVKTDEKLRFDNSFEIPDKLDDDKPPKRKDGIKKKFQIENQVDWSLEEELQKRRKRFMEDVAKRAEEYDPDDFKDMQELDDHLAFITAATDSTSWLAILQFIYSVQYFYPHSDIGVYDLGLSEDKRNKLKTFCRVSVIHTYMKFWPDHLTDVTNTLWRPMVWQMGLAHYGHIIYVEPERFLSKKNMKEYIEHSRRFGITVVGRKLQYSPFVVTHPEMYFFFNVDTRKLQRVNMFDLTMIIMHNSQPVRHDFMRHLVSCTLEEYCIAPPGAQSRCDQRLYPGSKKYANCHRYDLSAVNILLDKWFDFKQDRFLVRDIATAHYNGKDVSDKVKTCSKVREEI